MRTADVDILMVPGWLGCEPDHWQSRWVRNLKTAKLIGEEDWATPDKDKWAGNIIKEVAATSRPIVIVAHSVGVIDPSIVVWRSAAVSSSEPIAAPSR